MQSDLLEEIPRNISFCRRPTFRNDSSIVIEHVLSIQKVLGSVLASPVKRFSSGR